MAMISSNQAAYWIELLRLNLLEHCMDARTEEEHLEFLTTQYIQLNTINQAIKGKVVFVGAPR